MSSQEIPSLTVELLDPNAGVPLQSWTVSGYRLAQIGRAAECDIVIGSPYVSRTHAYLQGTEGRWQLCCISQHGMFVTGAKRESLEVMDGLEVRLGGKGPCLRFRLQNGHANLGAGETISFDPQMMPVLTMDVAQRDREVAEIAQGDYFHELLRKADVLRRQRKSTGAGEEQ